MLQNRIDAIVHHEHPELQRVVKDELDEVLAYIYRKKDWNLCNREQYLKIHEYFWSLAHFQNEVCFSQSRPSRKFTI